MLVNKNACLFLPLRRMSMQPKKRSSASLSNDEGATANRRLVRSFSFVDLSLRFFHRKALIYCWLIWSDDSFLKNRATSSLSFYSSGFDISRPNAKKQVTWSRSTESCTELGTSRINFRIGETGQHYFNFVIYSYFALANETDKQEEETATKKNLLKHEFSRTATITGLDAHILAEEVRKRRGTVYMHTDQVNEIFSTREGRAPHSGPSFFTFNPFRWAGP